MNVSAHKQCRLMQVGRIYPDKDRAVKAREGLGPAGPLAGLILRGVLGCDRARNSSTDILIVVFGFLGSSSERSGTSPCSRDIEVRDWCAVDGKSFHVETRRKRAIEGAKTGNCNSELLFLAHLGGETGACLAVGGGVVLYMC